MGSAGHDDEDGAFARRMRAHPTRSEALVFGQLRSASSMLGSGRAPGSDRRERRGNVFALGYIVDLYAPCYTLRMHGE